MLEESQEVQQQKHCDYNNKQDKNLRPSIIMIIIIDGALGTVSKGMERRLKKLKIKRIETIQSRA